MAEERKAAEAAAQAAADGARSAADLVDRSKAEVEKLGGSSSAAATEVQKRAAAAAAASSKAETARAGEGADGLDSHGELVAAVSGTGLCAQQSSPQQ